MTSEIFYLTLTSLLLATLWVPYIIGVNMNATPEVTDFTQPADKSGLPKWVRRADRAHVNLVEQYAPYAVLIVLLHITGVSNGWTVGAAAAFFYLRVAHAAGMITAMARYPVRPIIFTAAWICIVILGWQLIANG
ncbi:MAG: MAPEG family protein [Pseudomonadota bacterium]